MRDILARREGEKSVYYGEFSKYGWRKFRGEFVGKTLLLVNIKDKDEKIVADHLWFHLTKRFDKLGKLEKGQTLRFTARVQVYSKHRGEDFDYHLAYPDDLTLVESDTLKEKGQMTLF